MGAALAGLSPGLKIFLVVDLLLVMVFGVMAFLMLGGDGNRLAEDARTQDAAASETASPSAAAESANDVSTAPAVDPSSGQALEFASPTGNITCAMSSDQVSCAIANITTPPVVQNCSSAGAGHVVDLTAEGVFTPCADFAPGSAGASVDVLEYGNSHTVGPYTCTSASNGMSCVLTASGTGFRLATAGLTLLP